MASFNRYCAHEYEQYKEMAAAALAYKCVEVAYMKVAYYKHPGASKDRQELQTALQAFLPGCWTVRQFFDINGISFFRVFSKAFGARFFMLWNL